MSSSLKKAATKNFAIFAIFSQKSQFWPKIEKLRGFPYFYNIGQKNTGKRGQKTRKMQIFDFLGQKSRFSQNRDFWAKIGFLHIFRGNFEKISAEAAHFFKKSDLKDLLKHVYKRYKRYVYKRL